MPSPFAVYKLYLALRAHFTTEGYDIVKMRGRIRALEGTFLKRRDVYVFQRIGNKYNQEEVIDFLVANFSSGDRWGGVFDISAENVYIQWKAKKESLSYRYREELSTLCEKVSSQDDLFDTSKGHPIILREFLGGVVSIETLSILNKIVPFVSILDGVLDKDIIWPTASLLIRKYSPFVRINKTRYDTLTKTIFRNIFQEIP